ncbi:hypothetical protein RHSP_71234 [Rhizobium freirei PRF 81]|uniref:Uncharacterized protein n=1 Tax=Rhizobium freirei PRF 81 TaxID=363754 RepID=N6UTB5_9HYPH|nr:hypothetical protein RHSP_71234 [Rhizobium freirei PRF 81]
MKLIPNNVCSFLNRKGKHEARAAFYLGRPAVFSRGGSDRAALDRCPAIAHQPRHRFTPHRPAGIRLESQALRTQSARLHADGRGPAVHRHGRAHGAGNRASAGRSFGRVCGAARRGAHQRAGGLFQFLLHRRAARIHRPTPEYFAGADHHPADHVALAQGSRHRRRARPAEGRALLYREADRLSSAGLRITGLSRPPSTDRKPRRPARLRLHRLHRGYDLRTGPRLSWRRPPPHQTAISELEHLCTADGGKEQPGALRAAVFHRRQAPGSAGRAAAGSGSEAPLLDYVSPRFAPVAARAHGHRFPDGGRPQRCAGLSRTLESDRRLTAVTSLRPQRPSATRRLRIPRAAQDRAPNPATSARWFRGCCISATSPARDAPPLRRQRRLQRRRAGAARYGWGKRGHAHA